jgi:hypothetical protein
MAGRTALTSAPASIPGGMGRALLCHRPPIAPHHRFRRRRGFSISLYNEKIMLESQRGGWQNSRTRLRKRIVMLWWAVAIVFGWLTSGALIPVLWRLSKLVSAEEPTSTEVTEKAFSGPLAAAASIAAPD